MVVVSGGRRAHSPTRQSWSRSARRDARSAVTPSCAGSDRRRRGPRADGRDRDGDGRGRDPRRDHRPGLRRPALVLGRGGVRAVRPGRAAGQRACGGGRHTPPAADPGGRLRRRAAAARGVAAAAASAVTGGAVDAHGRRRRARDAASLVPETAVPTRAVVALLVVAVLPGGWRSPSATSSTGTAAAAGPAAVRARAGGVGDRPALPGGDGRADRSTRSSPRLRLLGVVVVLLALARLVARSLAARALGAVAQQEELRSRRVHLERAQELAAERDHELRNGLAGLAGITHLLSSRHGRREQRARSGRRC